eukprot:TRINITY_DN10838_c0_g1_i1.p1 TRINITY_DN10838_c0_g1~~TRINITY_DN10838_c0_g1_i1.p1  ORF type:complete len:520 (-),score=130.26 TRINITY_DN10838_c0_g1_i1:106-1608(-)
MPPEGHLLSIFEKYGHKQTLLDNIMNRVQYEKQSRKLRDQEDKDKTERDKRSRIDWHDFVVVETITFDDSTTEETAPKPEKTMSEEPHEMEVENMDMDMDDLDFDVDPELIRKEPIQRVQPKKDNKQDYSICPKCGEAIPIEELNEHMKIELLDRTAREARLKAMKEKRESSLAEGDEIERNLKRMAKRRTDIFGEKEVEIGRSVGDEELQNSASKPDTLIWDGHSGSIPRATNAVLAGVTDPNLVRAAEEEEKQRAAIGAALPPGPGQNPPLPTATSTLGHPPLPPGPAPPSILPTPMSMQPLVGMNPISMNRTLINPGGMMGRPSFAPYGTPMMPGGMPPMGMGPGGMPFMPMPGGGMPGGGMPMQRMPPPPPEGPDLKKRRLGNVNLVSAEQWAANYSGPITVLVKVPSGSAGDPSVKPEWKFEGQSLEFKLLVTSSVKDIKAKIKEALGGMPPNKQKLKLANFGYLKDTSTLAEYNAGDGVILELGVKARGGRSGK